MRAWRAQCLAEVRMTLQRGETLLLTVIIPVGLLAFFSRVAVFATPDRARVDFVAPGIMALCVLSTSLVALSIATGFERSYGVLRRLRTTPLSLRSFIGAKIAAVVVTEVIQLTVVSLVAVLLGWRPQLSVANLGLLVVSLVVGTAACAGIGLFLAGQLKAEVNLAAANGLYVVLLLGSGMVIPTSSLPGPLRGLAHVIPSGALADIAHRATRGESVVVLDLVSLVLWALIAPALAARTFRVD